MKIGNLNSGIAFKRALNRGTELEEYKNVLQQAREKVSGKEEGKSILIVHDVCLPQDNDTDTGIGHLTSKTSSEFFDFAKNYWGINTIEVLPPGEIQQRGHKGFYNTYNGSALSLGTQNIDLELLTDPVEYGAILPKIDLNEVVIKNQTTQNKGLVNYENVIGSDTPYEKALRTAYNNFKNNIDTIKTDKISKEKFEEYKENNNDWLEKKAIYSVLKEKNGGKEYKEWPLTLERELYSDSKSEKIKQLKDKYIEKIKKDYEDDINFYKFKQFLADTHLAEGRKKLNEKGMKLIGDCLIGFSDDEVWAYKKAFMHTEKGKIVYAGNADWKLPALNYDEITEDGSPANNLLKRKVELFAKRYDGIRFDASWLYVKPKLADSETKKYLEDVPEFKGQILDIIEQTVKKVKGADYNRDDLIHEFEAGEDDFSIVGSNKMVKTYIKDRVKVIGEAYMSKDYGCNMAMEKLNAKPDSYIIGVGNHDPQPLRQMADNIPDKVNGKYIYRKQGQERVLQKIFGVSEDVISTPEGFSQYKFAEPLLAKNKMVFYMDAFGRPERFDSQEYNGKNNYRYRIPTDYQKQYIETVQSGFGYSPMDGYSKIFKAKGYAQTQPDLFKKIVKFRDILREKTTAEDTPSNDESKKKSNKMLKAGGVAGLIALIAAVITGADAGLKNL